MSSGFVTQSELEEQRRQRQEEWEKVRKADDPLEAPEEKYDHRSLFERLEEQKSKKQLEMEEAHKLKNMIKGLDDDEVDFLDFVDRKKMENEQLKEREEKKELMEFRKNVEKLRESSIEDRMLAEIRPVKTNLTKNSAIKSQHQLLKGAVVKKKTEDSQNMSHSNESHIKDAQKRLLSPTKSSSDESESPAKRKRREDRGGEECVAALTCVGILPGLGSYGGSSDSDSDSSIERTLGHYDLLGRKLIADQEQVKEKKTVSSRGPQ